MTQTSTSVVLLTADGIEHRYVAERLAQALGPALSAVVVESGASHPQGALGSLRSAVRRYSPAEVVERLSTKAFRLLTRRAARRREALVSILGPMPDSLSQRDGATVVGSVNERAVLELLDRIGPDFLFVYGTGIVGRRVLEVPGTAALNLHTGISPEYRGSDSAFWALYEGRPWLVGATVHRCTSRVDGGEIYLVSRAELETDDDAETAFAKTVKVGAEAYASIARRILRDGLPDAAPQDDAVGREYRFKDRTLLHEIGMHRRLRSGEVARSIERAAGRDRATHELR